MAGLQILDDDEQMGIGDLRDVCNLSILVPGTRSDFPVFSSVTSYDERLAFKKLEFVVLHIVGWQTHIHDTPYCRL